MCQYLLLIKATWEDSYTKIAGTYYDSIPYFSGAPSKYSPYSSIVQHGENNNFL